MPQLNPLFLAGCLLIQGCDYSVTPPAVSLNFTAEARSIDAGGFPRTISTTPGPAHIILRFALAVHPDGLWNSAGWWRPATALQTDSTEFTDNGVYTFDGRVLTLHSDFTHTYWNGSAHGDTITVTGEIPVGDSPHTIVLWP